VDHYIVEIYRRGPSGQLHGVVERVGNGGRTGFSSVEELFAFLLEAVDDGDHPDDVRSPRSTGAKRATSRKPSPKGRV